MFGVFTWRETSGNAAGTTFSSVAVQQSDPSSAAGILSSSDIDGYELLQFDCEMVGATGGTLDVYVQSFFFGTWYDFLHIKTQNAGASANILTYIASKATTTSSVAIGKNSAPALASDTIIGGLWGEAFRLVMVAGASTSAGAAIKITMAVQMSRTMSQR